MNVTKININSDTKQNNVIKINIYKTKQEYTNVTYMSFIAWYTP